MSYIFLLEQGEESSAECFSDIALCAQWKSNHTAEKSCCKDSETESCHGSQSGTTCAPSTASRGEESSMSCAVASHVRTSAQPGKGLESLAPDLACGRRWRASWTKYDQDTSSWKTRQCSFLEGLDEFSETWPKWGMMHDGECWELPTPGLNTEENESGFLPTPLASDGDGGGICRSKNGREYNLRDWWANQGLGKRRQDRNPEFWEWVMGWPIGWSGLEPLATDRCQSWLHSHTFFFQLPQTKGAA